MVIEKGAYDEQEKKKKKIDNNEKAENQKKIIEQQKRKEYIKTEMEADDALFSLKELIDKGIISKETAQKIVDSDHIDEELIGELFDKIGEIEDIKDINNYLPAELRISKEDYKKALHDDIFRLQIITRLDSSLVLLAQQISPNSAGGINLFSGFISMLDKNLVKIQENTIDIKDSLVEIEEKKNPKEKIGFCNKLKIFFKDLLK